MRYYQFGKIVLAISGLPKNIEDGLFLEMFRISQRKADVEVKIVINQLYLPCELNDRVNDYRFYRDHKPYLIGWMTRRQPATCVSPIEWKDNSLTIEVNPVVLQEKYFTVNQLFSLSCLHSGLLFRDCGILHCSYIMVDNQAILFAGRSGVGKSTQASLWKQYKNAEIINGDRALIFKDNGKWFAGGFSICGSSQICKNKTVEIKCVILLEQGVCNELFEVSTAMKYRSVLSGLAFQQWIKEEVECATQLVMNFVLDVPIYKYSCLNDESAVNVLYDYLEVRK